MKKLTLKSPAKVNLYLNLLGKRTDGYHEVETIVQAIDLCDELTLEGAKDGIKISSSDPRVPTDEANLAYRAASLLIENLGVKKGVHIFIKKRIPIAAGLGGGSSNAAVTLVGLNRIWKLGLGKQRLIGLGRRLGMDIPFFVAGYPTAFCTGRGDEVSRLHSITNWYCLVVPPIEVCTEKAYKKVRYGEPHLTRPHNDVRMLAQALEEGDRRRIKRLVYNGLSVAVMDVAPVVAEVLKVMKSLGAEGVLMSGSGPCVFGLTSNRKEAVNLAKEVSSRSVWRTFVASTYNG